MNASKILVVGKLNDTLYSLSEYLMSDFQIQMCAGDNAENVKDMIRLYKPSIVLVMADEVDENLQEVFAVIEKKHGPLPLLVIGTTDMRSDLRDALENYGNKSIMYRPVVSSDVRKECMILLNVATKEVDEVEEVRRKQILIVDDNALVLRNTKSLLESEYDILLANTGIKALNLLQVNKVDLVLLDYDMPGMNGREVFEHMIEEDKTKDIPVVFLTSVAERERIYAVLKNKPYGYILKPPSNDKIISIIKEALD